ncbi:hypothetical protein OIDMADRAFT_46630 [Oidiodendron maius Zn]|uniref:Phytanoyl-CoA dioxygenase n=1 Tax=Oidiodendron maius (strain Zn) TaxID=913774 RepID=A0A0C3GQ31_OIDMZ|nr:hypothetical protein OIDMADRAFT_46630 [Oidiodendron maius Zn]
MAPTRIETTTLRSVPRDATAEEIVQIVREDGGVILREFLTQDQVDRFNSEIEPAMQKMEPGSVQGDEWIASFHGVQTKRLTNVVSLSKTFREEVLDDARVHQIADKMIRADSGDYWMQTTQIIEIGPGNKVQPLHRDLENQYPWVAMGPSGPEAAINFLIALTDFTEENGATRVIPGSHLWPDFTDRGTHEMTIPAVMNKGDALFISGKICHGGGENKSDQRRRGAAFTFTPSFLTPEEAYPFLVDLKLVRQMSKRAQAMLGFRSQYPRASPGLWQNDYKDISGFLGLDD